MILEIHPRRVLFSLFAVLEKTPFFAIRVFQVKVESGRRVGVGTAQWRTWMLQLTTFLQVRKISHKRLGAYVPIFGGYVVAKIETQSSFGGVL